MDQSIGMCASSVTALMATGVSMQEGAAVTPQTPVAAPAAGPAAGPVNVVGTPAVAGGTASTGALQPLGPAGGAAAPAASSGGFGPMFLPLAVVGIMVFMFYTQHRAQKKEQAKRQEMLNALKKGEKVETRGGVIGTVIELTESEVVLQVEQGKIRFARNAILQVTRASAGKSDGAVVESKPDSRVGAA